MMNSNPNYDSRDFDEHYLPSLPTDEDGGSLDVYMRLSTDKGHENVDKDGELTFVSSNGLHLSLVKIPFKSLKALARFIRDTVKDWES